MSIKSYFTNYTNENILWMF